ncbi:MAG: APC family permease [Actinomycetes bacterium]
MATAGSTTTTAVETQVDKGLKSNALGLVSSIVIGVASTAPAYSLAATLGLIVVGVGLASPLVTVMAFIPMLLVSIGYSELNKADPDCGTTFTWGTRTFGPWVGWMGGWGIIVADVLVMASLAQVTGQYFFLLFNANGIGDNATSGWVLLVGVLFIASLTYICYRGIELSARVQKVLLSVEVVMLAVFALVALGRVALGNAPAGYLHPAWSWFNPSTVGFSPLVSGVLLMLFIYWGWDTSLSVNEETKNKTKTPGQAAIISTVMLLAIYFLVTLAAQSFAGIGDTGIGLANPDHITDVISVLGTAVFGTAWYGSILAHLLILMVLTSAAASTQTTILPTARTALSMGVYRGLPKVFAKMHPRYLTPTVATLVMGGVSIVMYALMNFLAGGYIIADSVTAIGIWIAFYYGLTGLTCAWYYRKSLTKSARNLWMQGILPGLGGLMLYFALLWSMKADWDVNSDQSWTSWQMGFAPHWELGGVFLIFLVTMVLGLVLMVLWRFGAPGFFAGETLNRATPTLVPEEDDDVVVLSREPSQAQTDHLAGRGLG